MLAETCDLRSATNSVYFRAFVDDALAGAFEREELDAFADFDALALLLLALEVLLALEELLALEVLLAFDVLGRAALEPLLLRVECLRGLRSGRFQSTALSARKLAGITIGPSA